MVSPPEGGVHTWTAVTGVTIQVTLEIMGHFMRLIV